MGYFVYDEKNVYYSETGTGQPFQATVYTMKYTFPMHVRSHPKNGKPLYVIQ